MILFSSNIIIKIPTAINAIEVDQAINVNKVLSIDPVFSTVFPVAFSEEAYGCTIAVKSWMEKFGEWKQIKQAENWKEDNYLTWQINVFEPGYYQVDLNYSGAGRIVWRVLSEEGNLLQNEQNSATIYSYFPMGLLKFDTPGIDTVKVSLVSGIEKSKPTWN